MAPPLLEEAKVFLRRHHFGVSQVKYKQGEALRHVCPLV